MSKEKQEKPSFEEMLELDRSRTPELFEYLDELLKRHPPVPRIPKNVTLH